MSDVWLRQQREQKGIVIVGSTGVANKTLRGDDIKIIGHLLARYVLGRILMKEEILGRDIVGILEEIYYAGVRF